MAFDPDAFLANINAVGPVASVADDDTPVGEASTFADPRDVARFRAAKARGLTDQQAFKVGDNGQGAWGEDTTSQTVPMVALPRDVLAAYYGHEDAGHGGQVEIIGANGQPFTAIIADKMPATEHITNGANIDFNPAAARLAGHTGGVAPVHWRFADGPLAKQSASETPPANGSAAGFDPDAFLASVGAHNPAAGTDQPGNPFAPPAPSPSDVLDDTFTPAGRAALDKLVRPNPALTEPSASTDLSGVLDGVLHGSQIPAVDRVGAKIGDALVAAPLRLLEDQHARHLESQPQPQVDATPDALDKRRLEIQAELADIDEENAHGEGVQLPSPREQLLRAELKTLTPQGQITATETAAAAKDARENAEHLTVQDVGHQLANAGREVRGGAATGALGITEGGARLRAGANPTTPGAAAAYLDGQIAQHERDLADTETLLQEHPASLELSAERDRIQGKLATLRHQRADILHNLEPGDVPGLGKADLLTPAGQGERARGAVEANAVADTLQAVKADTGMMFGQDPALKDTKLARSARAGGEVLPLAGASLIPGVGIVAGAGAAGLQAKASAYDEYYGEALGRGESEEQARKEAQDYSDATALRTVPEMVTFLGTGRIAAKVVNRLLSPAAPAAVRTLATTAASTLANAAAGTGNQLVEQGVGGKLLDASYSLERGVQDTLFGGMHAVGETGNRAAELKALMKQDAVASQPLALKYNETRRTPELPAAPVGTNDTAKATPPVFAPGDTLPARAASFLEKEKSAVAPVTAARFEPGEDVPASLGGFPRVEQPDGATVIYDPQAHTPEDFQPAPVPATSSGETSTRNVSTDAERTARGFTPAEQAARRDFGQTWDEAKATLQDDPTAGQRLVAELNASPRAATDRENALLLHEQITAQGEHDAAVQAVNDAPDDAARLSAQARLAKASDDLFNLYEATKKVGTETGRGLAARRFLARQDYTLANMLNRRRAAEGGQPLTSKQSAEVEAAHAEVADTQARLTAHEHLVDEVDAHLAGDPDWTPPADPEAEAEAAHRADLAREAREGVNSAGGVELLDAIRDAGGLPTEDSAFQGELQTIREAHAPVGQAGRAGTFNLFRRGAPKLDELTSRLREHGFDVETPDDTLNLIYGRLTDKKPVYGFSARAEAQSGMAGSEAYFRRQRTTPPRTPEELRSVQEKWNRALQMVAPKTALRLEVIHQDALDAMGAKGTGKQAARMGDVIYLSAKALRANPKELNAVNLHHEIAHAFEDTLTPDERTALQRQWKQEMASSDSPLHTKDGSPHPDVDPRAFDASKPENFSEWFAERVAWENHAHFADAVASHTADTAVGRVAARMRQLVMRVWKAVTPGMAPSEVSAKYRDFLNSGGRRVGEPAEASGVKFAQRDTTPVPPPVRPLVDHYDLSDLPGETADKVRSVTELLSKHLGIDFEHRRSLGADSVRVEAGPRGEDGKGKYRGSYHGEKARIVVPTGKDAAAVVAHEIGHQTHDQIIGGGPFAEPDRARIRWDDLSRETPQMIEFLKRLNGTQAGRRLMARARESAGKNDVFARNYRYLARPEERFARAVEQASAHLTGDPRELEKTGFGFGYDDAVRLHPAEINRILPELKTFIEHGLREHAKRFPQNDWRPVESRGQENPGGERPADVSFGGSDATGQAPRSGVDEGRSSGDGGRVRDTQRKLAPVLRPVRPGRGAVEEPQFVTRRPRADAEDKPDDPLAKLKADMLAERDAKLAPLREQMLRERDPAGYLKASLLRERDEKEARETALRQSVYDQADKEARFDAAVRERLDPRFAARRGPLTEAERLANAKSSLKRRRDDLLRRVASGDLARVKRERVRLDAEGLRLQAEHARAKQSFDEAVEKARRAKLPLSVRTMEHVSGLARAGAISGYHTIGKLASFSMGALAERPLTELSSAIIEHTPGMRRIAAKADLESGAQVKSLAKFYSQFAGRGMKEAWKVLRTGKSTDTLLYGKPRPGEVKNWYDFVGQVHDAEKTPLFTAAQEAYRTKAYEHAIRNGIDPTDPTVRGIINQKAYEYALQDKLQENNGFAEWIRAGHKKLESANPATGKFSTEKMLLSTLAKAFLTKGIVKTPANFVKQALFERSPIGLARGIAKGIDAHVRGVENLTDQEANHITRLMKLGMVGTAMTLWGVYDAFQDEKDRIFGGYYQPGDKRGDNDVGFGRIRVAGHSLPHWATHFMLTEPAQFGSTIVRVARATWKKHGEQKGYAEGVFQAALAPINNAPVVGSGLRFERDSKQGGLSQVASTLVSGLIPGLVRDYAEDSDQKDKHGEPVRRTPTTIADAVRMDVPGWRRDVPLKKE